MSDILNILICEDMKSDQEHLLELIHKSNYETDCTMFSCGEDLVAAFKPHKYDLLLTDIYMEGMTGIEAVTKIRELDKDIPVAFVTSSLDHALESYRLSALKYIEKPYKKSAIEDILHLALLEKKSIPSLIIQKNGKDKNIPFNDISYLEQHSHKLIVHFFDGTTEEFYEKLSNILVQLDGQNFINCHKSFAVHLPFVRSIDSDVRCFVMDDNSNVPIRRESFVQAKKTLANFLFEKTRNIE